jgi:hypothetical protein
MLRFYYLDNISFFQKLHNLNRLPIRSDFDIGRVDV